MPNCSLAGNFIGENSATILTESKYPLIMMTSSCNSQTIHTSDLLSMGSQLTTLIDINTYIKPSSYRF